MKILNNCIVLSTLGLALISACADTSLPVMPTSGGVTAQIPSRAICGDGILAATEECDDGNFVDGDGCSQFCRIEMLVGGTPIAGMSMAGSMTGGEAVGGSLVGGEAVGGEAVGGEPVGGEPVGGEPVGGQPVGGQPVGGEAVGGQPVGGQPVGGESLGGSMMHTCEDDVYEDNDEITMASPLNPRSITEPLSLAICSGDPDYFIIQGCAGAELQVTLTQMDEFSDLDLRLTAQDGRQFAASATENPVEVLRYVFSADHAAYLNIYGYQASEGRYELSLSLSDCAVMSECSSDQDCAINERCEQRSCVVLPPPDPECFDDQDCLADEQCTNGVCERRPPPPPECVNNLDCPANEYCVNGACEIIPTPPECLDNFDCNVNEICINERCETLPPQPECFDDFDCNFDEICEQEICVALPPNYCESFLDCFFLDDCINNVCVSPPPECIQHSECASDEVCNGGACLYEPAECSSHDECGLGNLCISERCVIIEQEDSDCIFDSNCGPLATCDDHACFGQESSRDCEVDADCGSYQVCSSTMCVFESDRIENDDDLATAEVLTSNLYGHLTIESNDDDWIAVDVCAGGTLDAEIRFSHALGDLDFKLFDANENALASSVSITDHESIMYQSDTEQRLYLKVYGFFSATNSYDLYIRVNGCGNYQQDELEDNDHANTAKILNPGLYRELTITERDSDWYATDICAGGVLRIDLQFSDAQGDLDLKLYNESENQLAFSTTGTDDEQVAYTSPNAQRLYWRVYGFGGAENQYEMSVMIEGCQGSSYLEEDRLEDNDQFTGAELLTPNLYGNLTISQRHDDDWIVFDVCAGGTAEVEIDFDDFNADIELELYDQQLNLVANSLSVSSPEIVSAQSFVSQLFYARVYGYRGDTGRYDLWLRVSGCP